MENTYGIRFEITTNSYNIYSFQSIILDLIEDKYFYITSTKNIIFNIIIPFLKYLESLYKNENYNENILKYKGTVLIYEQIVFEYFIRGGWNIHCIPSICSNYIKNIQSEGYLICPGKIFDCVLANIDVGYSLSRAIYYSNIFNEYEKCCFEDLIDGFTGGIDLNELAGLVVKNFIIVFDELFEHKTKATIQKSYYSPQEYLKNNFYLPIKKLNITTYTMLLGFCLKNFKIESLDNSLILASYYLKVEYGVALDNADRVVKKEIEYGISLECYAEPKLALRYIFNDIEYKAKTINENREKLCINGDCRQKKYRDVTATPAEVLYYIFITEKLNVSRSDKEEIKNSLIIHLYI